MRKNPGWLGVVSVSTVMVAALGWQFKTSRELRAELVRGKSPARTNVEDVRAAAGTGGAAHDSRIETTADGTLTDELQRARQEAASLKQRVEFAARNVAEKEAEMRFAAGTVMPASDWKNAGTATAKAALETVLWAGASGDVNELAQSIHFIGRTTRTMAENLLAGMPPQLREKYNTPEKLIAFLTVRDVPLGAAEVRRFRDIDGWPAPTQSVNLFLTSSDGKQRGTTLIFTNPGSGWKLVATDAVVERYAAALKAPAKANEK
jgi:hypothetical protein